MTDIVRHCKVGQERQRDLEQQCSRMQEDQQIHQQQMIEILEKVSDQVQKVENMHSESIPVLEREYPMPPVSHTRTAIPGKLSASPKPTYVFRAGTSAKHQRVDRSMAFPSRGCFSNPQ